jgi:hypothetical protein
MSDKILQNFKAQDELITIGYHLNKSCVVEKSYKHHMGSQKNADTKISIFQLKSEEQKTKCIEYFLKDCKDFVSARTHSLVQSIENNSGFAICLEDQKNKSKIMIHGNNSALQQFIDAQGNDDMTELFLRKTMTTRNSLFAFPRTFVQKKKFYPK